MRTPALGEEFNGDVVRLDKRIALRSGQPVVLPFSIPVPADAAPSAAGVHSSVTWFLAARMFYAGFNSHMTERVRLPIVMINAP